MKRVGHLMRGMARTTRHPGAQDCQLAGRKLQRDQLGVQDRLGPCQVENALQGRTNLGCETAQDNCVHDISKQDSRVPSVLPDMLHRAPRGFLLMCLKASFGQRSEHGCNRLGKQIIHASEMIVKRRPPDVRSRCNIAGCQ